MKKTIVLDFDNNLICKNCGVTTAVSFINLRTAIDLFMSQHNECKHGDDVITLNEIASIIGISKFNFRNFTNKLNMPEPLPYSKEFGQKKLFNRSVINQWLIDSDVRNLIYKIAAEERRKKNPNTKPYVPRHNKPKKEVVIEEKRLKTQRDELLEACNDFVNAVRAGSKQEIMLAIDAADKKARAAIAKAHGENNA